MRNIHELLILTRVYVLKYRWSSQPTNMIYSGLCTVLHIMNSKAVITNEEKRVITTYLYANRPKNNYINSAWFWDLFKIKPRLAWCTVHIKRTAHNNRSFNQRKSKGQI